MSAAFVAGRGVAPMTLFLVREWANERRRLESSPTPEALGARDEARSRDGLKSR